MIFFFKDHMDIWELERPKIEVPLCSSVIGLIGNELALLFKYLMF